MSEEKGIRPEMREYLFDRYCQIVTGRDFAQTTGSAQRVMMPEGKVAKQQFREDFNRISDFGKVELGLGSGIWYREDE